MSGLAIDGKAVRGAAAGGGPRPFLLAAACHDAGVVLAQCQIPDKGGEIHEVSTLLEQIDVTGRVVTLDALHTQHKSAEHLVTQARAEYIMTIKANQPGLLNTAQQMLSGPAENFDGERRESGRGHARTEERIVRATIVNEDSGFVFPHAAQLFPRHPLHR